MINRERMIELLLTSSGQTREELESTVGQDETWWTAFEKFTQAVLDEPRPPIDMMLYCPECGAQHIDRPEIEPTGNLVNGATEVRYLWANPPHKSHLCHNCKEVWRPADVPTNGVDSTETCGRKDTHPFGKVTQLRARKLRGHEVHVLPVQNFNPVIKIKLTRKLGDVEMLEVTDIWGSYLCDVPFYLELKPLFGDRSTMYFMAKFVNGFLTLQDNISPSEFQ